MSLESVRVLDCQAGPVTWFLCWRSLSLSSACTQLTSLSPRHQISDLTFSYSFYHRVKSTYHSQTHSTSLGKLFFAVFLVNELQLSIESTNILLMMCFVGEESGPSLSKPAMAIITMTMMMMKLPDLNPWLDNFSPPALSYSWRPHGAPWAQDQQLGIDNHNGIQVSFTSSVIRYNQTKKP